MEDSKEFGAKQALQNMLYYYLSSIMNTVKDPKQYIATELGKMIDLSEDQVLYVKQSISSNNLFVSNLESCIKLLSDMEEKKKLDIESVSIVKNVLSLIKEEAEKALKNEDNIIDERE